MPKASELSGDSVLYSYLQKELLEDDIWLFQMLTARLVTALGVWLHPDIYRSLPIILPHVIRDASARGRATGTERWAEPTADGYLRDDNSLIKEAVKRLTFSSSRPIYSGKCIGSSPGWVACHVWRMARDGTRTNVDPLLNSFVPNLVWLPSELAKLSDRDGSFVQSYLQAVAAHLYRAATPAPAVREFANRAWARLRIPRLPEGALPDSTALNYFGPDEGWVSRQRTKVQRVLGSLESTARGGKPDPSLKPSRYRQGLPGLTPRKTAALRQMLRRYLG
jgi:hypothetical protein